MPPTETKVWGCKVMDEGGRLVHTAISMIYWPMGRFLRAAGIPFCSRTSVTVHQTDKSRCFAVPILYCPIDVADGEGGESKTVSKAIEQGQDFHLHNMIIFIYQEGLYVGVPGN